MSVKPPVILLHGLFHNKYMLARTAYALRRDYDVLNISYPSRRMSFESLVDFVHNKIQAAGMEAHPLNFVGHSLGGLIIRAYINKYRPAVGRVVIVGTPNAGSELVDVFSQKYPWVGQSLGKAASILMTRRSPEHIQMLGQVDYPLGVIAGTKSRTMASLWIQHPHDGTVTVASTRVEGMADHISLPASHSSMMFNKQVVQQVKYFLQHGHFDRPAN